MRRRKSKRDNLENRNEGLNWPYEVILTPGKQGDKVMKVKYTLLLCLN